MPPRVYRRTKGEASFAVARATRAPVPRRSPFSLPSPRSRPPPFLLAPHPAPTHKTRTRTRTDPRARRPHCSPALSRDPRPTRDARRTTHDGEREREMPSFDNPMSPGGDDETLSRSYTKSSKKELLKQIRDAVNPNQRRQNVLLIAQAGL